MVHLQLKYMATTNPWPPFKVLNKCVVPPYVSTRGKIGDIFSSPTKIIRWMRIIHSTPAFQITNPVKYGG